jgi:hypothetical protein
VRTLAVCGLVFGLASTFSSLVHRQRSNERLLRLSELIRISS